MWLNAPRTWLFPCGGPGEDGASDAALVRNAKTSMTISSPFWQPAALQLPELLLKHLIARYVTKPGVRATKLGRVWSSMPAKCFDFRRNGRSPYCQGCAIPESLSSRP
jgi:hypothetical protein